MVWRNFVRKKVLILENVFELNLIPLFYYDAAEINKYLILGRRQR